MNFLELKEKFESNLIDNFNFELLELHYAPYAFGSGMTAYRIKGRIFRINYDGKDNLVQFLTSLPHEKYPNASWSTIFSGLPKEFIDIAIAKLNSLHEQGA
jgi:hypothetical protein